MVHVLKDIVETAVILGATNNECRGDNGDAVITLNSRGQITREGIVIPFSESSFPIENLLTVVGLSSDNRRPEKLIVIRKSVRTGFQSSFLVVFECQVLLLTLSTRKVGRAFLKSRDLAYQELLGRRGSRRPSPLA